MKKAKLLFTILIISLIQIACDGGTGLLTKEELRGMYQISIQQDDNLKATNKKAETTLFLKVTNLGMRKTTEYGTVHVSIADQNSKEVVASIFATPNAKGSKTAEISSILGELPPIKLPSNLAEGYYSVNVTIKNLDELTLASASKVILIFYDFISNASINIYPGLINTDSVSLLKFQADMTPNLNPWIVWKIDGKEVSAGFYKNKADRFLWKAPKLPMIAKIQADLYPYKPPSNGVKPFSVVNITIPVSDKATELIIPEKKIYSMLPFDGTYIDKAIRQDASKTLEPVGQSYFESYNSGYGCIFEANSGIIANYSMVPVDYKTKKLLPFTAIFTLAIPEKSNQALSCALLTVNNSDNTAILKIGLNQSVPFVSSKTKTVTATEPLHAGGNRLAVYIGNDNNDNNTKICFYIDEKPIYDYILTENLFTQGPTSSVVAMSDGDSPIYDALHIIKGAFPYYRISENLKHGSNFICASGFENGELEDAFKIDGNPILKNRSLELASGDKLLLNSAATNTEAIDIEIVEGDVSASIMLADGSNLVINSAGRIYIGKELLPEKLTMRKPAFNFGIEVTKKYLTIHGQNTETITIETPLADKASWSIQATSSKAVISSISNYKKIF